MAFTVLAVIVLAGLSFQQTIAQESLVLQNDNGMEVHLIQTGAIVQRLLVPDAGGNIIDVVAGFDDPALYQNNLNSQYFGAIIGRVVSRIANATFELDGVQYHTSANENGNTQHGGSVGWSAKDWTLERVSDALGDAARLTLLSPDGDQGFPGTVNASVTYILTPDNHVILEFEAETDEASPINMVSHSYFNLDGPGTNKTILDHELFINASYLTPLDKNSVPYGTFESVEDTPYDFRIPETIGSRIIDVEADFPGGNSENGTDGYDVNYVLWGLTGPESEEATDDCKVFDEPRLAATVTSSDSGLAMDVIAQTPGLELYTSNHLNGSVVGKAGARYPQFGCFSLEAEIFPNAINQDGFAKCIVTPDNPYRQTLIWRFYNASTSVASA